LAQNLCRGNKAMNRPYEPLKKIVEYTLPWLVLAILIIYTYARFFQQPYGFRWSSDGIIEDVFVKQGPPSLKIGDQIIKIGRLDWETFHTDLNELFSRAFCQECQFLYMSIELVSSSPSHGDCRVQTKARCWISYSANGFLLIYSGMLVLLHCYLFVQRMNSGSCSQPLIS
jgi:hypothetical protein